MKRKFCISISIIVAVAFMAGCASIVSKSEYPIVISSTPDSADISITVSPALKMS
ncbi:MAG: hypothetical protein KKB94_08915 [Proteobacteria bacterium]|nr:hypothetical protein [Pseudomonadota bacterium]